MSDLEHSEEYYLELIEELSPAELDALLARIVAERRAREGAACISA